MNDLGLYQKKFLVIHVNNTLDLIYTNCQNYMISRAIDLLVKEDIAHPVLNISLDFLIEKNKIVSYSQNYKFEKFNFNDVWL